MFEINSISYEKLHTEVYKLLPANFVKGTFIQEHLSKNFDHRLINFDPYKEILPTYYSWHKKGEAEYLVFFVKKAFYVEKMYIHPKSA